jgi:isoleucyl-tRNA synthetase
VVHLARDAGEAADGSETTYRQLAIEEIDKVVWDPAWGKERITNMIATRPDWCISRQRIWGVPIAVFLCERVQPAVIDAALNRKIVDLFEREGAEAWHTTRRRICCLRARTCAHCGGKRAIPQRDRHSRRVVRFRRQLVCRLRNRRRSQPRFCTGHDFRKNEKRARRSSTLKAAISTAAGSTLPADFGGAARPRALLHVATVGWTLDEQGRAMSKSLGNGVDPVDIANRMGGEIVRLWVASVDFREDMAASENLMQRCAELYRKLRNTFRFLLGNLNGFDPARDRVPKPSCCRSTVTCWPARAS